MCGLNGSYSKVDSDSSGNTDLWTIFRSTVWGIPNRGPSFLSKPPALSITGRVLLLQKHALFYKNTLGVLLKLNVFGPGVKQNPSERSWMLQQNEHFVSI